MSKIVGKFVNIAAKDHGLKGRQGIVVEEHPDGCWVAVEGEDFDEFFYFEELTW